MPFCPKCRDEFQDWVKVCPDCGENLVEKLEPVHNPVYSEKPLEQLVTIASFLYPEQAHIVSTKLESEGIWSFVADEYVSNANWTYTLAIGGVKVQVKESDAEEAIKILHAQNETQKLSPEPEEVCPNCGSANIHYEPFHSRPLFLSWLIFVPIPFVKRKWKCNSC